MDPRIRARRIANLKLTPEQHAQKLREGVSIYYNLSSKGRSAWNGLNTAKLPIETRRPWEISQSFSMPNSGSSKSPSRACSGAFVVKLGFVPGSSPSRPGPRMTAVTGVVVAKAVHVSPVPETGDQPGKSLRSRRRR